MNSILKSLTEYDYIPTAICIPVGISFSITFTFLSVYFSKTCNDLMNEAFGIPSRKSILDKLPWFTWLFLAIFCLSLTWYAGYVFPR